jgi:BirA family biotin operon repressor/biotin-[acetyl-CoA-carboxylase] ligase
MATPYALIELDQAQSTQDEAFARAGNTPVLVVTGRQSAGRGRHGRHWENAPRSVAASLALRPTGWPAESRGRLSLVAALAGRSVLADSTGPGHEPTCKWPNDLLRDDLKLAGLLLEAAGDVVAIGLGVNLWWPEPPAGVGAVFEHDPGPAAVLEVATRWCTELLARVNRGAEDWGRDEYRQLCRTIGRQIRWLPEGSGTALDVDDLGRLVVRTDLGLVPLASGEVWAVG